MNHTQVVCVCAAFAYMSVLGQQHVASTASGLPSSLSLNDLKLQAVSHPSPDVHCDTSTVAAGECASVVVTGELQAVSLRQYSVDSLLNTGFFIESPGTCQSPGSYLGSSQANVDSQYHGVGSEMLLSSQRSVDSLLHGHVVVPSYQTCRSVDLDHDVFCDLTSSQLSQKADIDQPPPLPPKTYVVSSNTSVCVCVLTCINTS